MESVICPERRLIGGSMYRIIVCKLGTRKQSYPVILRECRKAMEILHQSLICPFCLAITLWMISRWQAHFNGQRALRNLKLNCTPLSEIMLFGMPRSLVSSLIKHMLYPWQREYPPEAKSEPSLTGGLPPPPK